MEAHLPKAALAEERGANVVLVRDSAAAPPSSAAALEKLRVAELRDQLRELGLPVSGRKAELLESCASLGIAPEDVTILDDEALRDGRVGSRPGRRRLGAGGARGGC